MDDEIEASLRRLESQFFESSPAELDSPYSRLLRIGKAMLAANEKKYHVTPDESRDFNTRLQEMKAIIVREVEKKLFITPRKGQSLLDRIRACFCSLDSIVAEDLSGSPYENKLRREYREAVSPLYHDLWRVLQLVAIYDGYATELMSVERFMDVLCLLEMEVFDERRIWGPRKAIIKIGQPLNLHERLNDYRADKRAVVRKTSLDLENSVRTMLEKLAAENVTPLTDLHS
jgi:hypothetical protein